MKTYSLDLGCGKNPKNFFNANFLYGIDIRDDIDLNIVKADLVIEKIPFEDSFFDFVTAHDFIEHIPRIVYTTERIYPFVNLMSEIWRVLKYGGKFLSVTPAYPNQAAFTDPTHVNFITDQTFNYFDAQNNWAKMYGFKGAFVVEDQHWEGLHLISILVKVPLQN
jgi:SAM-dependent methyltransferase